MAKASDHSRCAHESATGFNGAQRHGISHLPLSEDGQSPPKKKFKDYLIGYLHVDFAEVQTGEGRQYRPNA